MGYGVNRKWQSTSGRARRAGSSSARGTTRKRKTRSAPRAKKKKVSKRSSTRTTARPKKKRQPARSRSTRSRAPKKKAAKKYTRYDPETGRSVKVTEDDYRFDEWPSRKPSAKQRKVNKLRADPVKYLGEELGKEAAKQVTRRAKSTAQKVGTAVAGSGIVARALPAIGAVSAIAAAGVLGAWMVDLGMKATGDKIAAVSFAFVDAQKALIQKTGARNWQEVPEGPRNKLLSEYKEALDVVTRRDPRRSAHPTFAKVVKSALLSNPLTSSAASAIYGGS